MVYAFLGHLTSADTAFEAWASSIEGVFESAAMALLSVMLFDPRKLRAAESRVIEEIAAAPEDLLHAFLERLVFLKDAEALLLKPRSIQVRHEGSRYILRAEMEGSYIDPDKQELLTDVKAVTYHGFELVKAGRGWKATVVLDV